jgi:leader peptidase (prepilin peptidase)/N-methyltransferase
MKLGAITSAQTIITFVVYCLFFSALIVLSGIDIFYQTVPDRVNIFIFILGIFLIIADYTSWASHLIGFFAVSVPLLILMMFGGMGGGDVKLYAAAGFLMGWKSALISLILACLIGAVMGLPVYIPQKRKGIKHPRIPFVPAIAIAMFISVFWGDSIINWYVSTFFGNLI